MNIGSFFLAGKPLYGLFSGDAVTPASTDFITRFPALRDVLDADALELLRQDTEHTRSIPISEITFLPPIPNPRKIICVGMNYRKPYPVDGVAPPDPDNIILFGKEREALVAHEGTLEIPTGEAAESFDYEGEIAVVIGRTARHLTVEEAMSHVLGYAAFNDGSVRDWQKHSVYAGKNFARSGAWGPWITTADSLPPAEELDLTVTLNDQIVQRAFGREMIFSIAEQIAYASHLFTLRPGDVMATGSPDGTGGSRTPKRFLKPGDVVQVAIAGVGTLANGVSGIVGRSPLETDQVGS
ncbi:MAG: fumarylacetoacetate hydrolase family protein [Paracoccaceae bacterium]|nr:fumarylacetoacetate hydrolase family protein [Paracoccaceae bacterium]